MQLGKIRFKVFIRPALAIVFAFIGVYIARIGIPIELSLFPRLVIFGIGALAFGFFGFMLPEILTVIGKAGLVEIANLIVGYLPRAEGGQIHFGKALLGQDKPKRQPKKYLYPVVVDTSVLVDGRIAEIAKSGFLLGTLLVIPSVISELHKLSDSENGIRRARGRRGLDILEEIQKSKKTKVEVLKSEPGDLEVDNKLISLAKKQGAPLMTLDFNLGKVARVKKVEVLNINELSNALKARVLPGQELSVEISASGKAKDQGVGFLEDGTMVVVEGGAELKGRNLSVKVLKVLQTAAGRMIFARPPKD